MQAGSGSPLSKRQRCKSDDVSQGNDNPSFDSTNGSHRTHQECARPPKSLHIAPMIRVSNREFRQLFRILSKRCVLWTEMVVDETVYYCSRSKQSSSNGHENSTVSSINRDKVDMHLDYDRAVEHPIVCQIGGIQPLHTAFASRIMAEEYGYDEINLNMGCPSDRVSGKEFGAVLMQQCERACELVRTMKESCGSVPISVKLRIGVDDAEEFAFVRNLVQRLHDAGCNRFYVHARKVLLQGLNPAQNRLIPPLNYPIVYRLCEEFPQCDFWINGGISGLGAAKAIVFGVDHIDATNTNGPLSNHSVPCVLCNYPNGSCIAPPSKAKVPVNLRGCMLGRAAMDNPSLFWDCDRYFYGEQRNPCQSRREVLEKYIDYLDEIYPRRCCDDVSAQTNRIPSPALVHTKDYCEICSEWRKQRPVKSSPINNRAIMNQGHNESADWTSSFITHKRAKKKTKAKITTHIVSRALRPIQGIFFGMSASKIFRRRCEELTQNLTIRNCGPAFILASAMKVVPDGVLDASFQRTEDLTNSNLVEHVSPRESSFSK